jgi:hypothetical protein
MLTRFSNRLPAILFVFLLNGVPLNSVLLIGVLLIGCGKASDGRLEVSGTITLHGETLDEGVIEFLPLADTKRAGPATQSGAVITNGAYKIPSDSGLVAGSYKVLITAGDGKTPVDGELPGPTGNIVSVDRIPAEYNIDSKQEVTVTPKGPNIFDYAIP